MRFLFELDKSLLNQGIDVYPGKQNLEVKKIFIPIEKILSKDLSDDDAKRFLNAIYTRVNDILTQTHDGKVSYCLLIHESLMFAFKNARRQGYLELIIMLQQLGALILIYPFVAEVTYMDFLSKTEVKFMVEYLIENIKEYYNKFCKRDDKGFVRTDPLYKDLKKQLESVYGIVDEEKNDFDYSKSVKLPPLDVWDKICLSFH